MNIPEQMKKELGLESGSVLMLAGFCLIILALAAWGLFQAIRVMAILINELFIL